MIQFQKAMDRKSTLPRFIGVVIVLLFCFYINFLFTEEESKNRPFLYLEPNTGNFELCANLLTNVTTGYWIRKIDKLKNSLSDEYQSLLVKEREFNEEVARFRVNRGIHTRLWRDDFKCGYRNLQAKPKGSKWGSQAARPGSWCDARSDRPCCTDTEDGVCGNDCECPGCVDMRKIYHAEFSEWVPEDSRCTVRNYTTEEACRVVGKFSEIRFFGDSFVRKMFRALILVLRNNPTDGSSLKRYTPALRGKCTGAEQFYWKECNINGGNVPTILVDDSPVCGGKVQSMVYTPLWKLSSARSFLDNIKKIAGRPGTLVIVDIGFHDRCNFNRTWHEYLEPAVLYLDKYYNSTASAKNGGRPKLIARWPHLIFTLPDTQGLLKPMAYRKANGHVTCKKFCEKMKHYCKSRNVPVLDYSQLTTGIHSYDGTHHGFGANLMKIQILLNYLDSLHIN